jgi:hypothetical protein
MILEQDQSAPLVLYTTDGCLSTHSYHPETRTAECVCVVR